MSTAIDNAAKINLAGFTMWDTKSVCERTLDSAQPEELNPLRTVTPLAGQQSWRSVARVTDYRATFKGRV